MSALFLGIGITLYVILILAIVFFVWLDNVDYSQVDPNYNQNNGMYPTVWGPVYWDFLHFATMGYPVTNPSNEVKNAFKTLLLQFGKFIPCVPCAKTYDSLIFTVDLDSALTSRDKLAHLVFELHNRVNLKLHKKQYNWQTFQKKYNNARVSNSWWRMPRRTTVTRGF